MPSIHYIFMRKLGIEGLGLTVIGRNKTDVCTNPSLA